MYRNRAPELSIPARVHQSRYGIKLVILHAKQTYARVGKPTRYDLWNVAATLLENLSASLSRTSKVSKRQSSMFNFKEQYRAYRETERKINTFTMRPH